MNKTEMLRDITTDDILMQSDDSLKHKIIFVAGFLTRKYDTQSASDNDDDAQELTVFSDFTQQLDRGGFVNSKVVNSLIGSQCRSSYM